MVIQHKQKDNHEMFFIEEDGDILAEIIYVTNEPNTIIIQHTEVSPELKGQNVGFSLVAHVVEHARTHGKKIVPVCSFARSVFDKKPDFGDVLG